MMRARYCETCGGPLTQMTIKISDELSMRGPGCQRCEDRFQEWLDTCREARAEKEKATAEKSSG